MHQDHVSHLSAWVFPFSALSAQLCIPVAFRLGSLRFLIPPAPTKEFRFPYGWPTERIDRLPDLIGVVTFRMCETQLGRMPPVLRGRGCPFP